MYVRRHHVRNVKLLRDVTIDFLGPDGKPRMWTVFVGENRLCKTTLLQTIAAAASGVDRGTQLVTDVVASWPDLRDPVPLAIESEFGFNEARHPSRRYPGWPEDARAAGVEPPPVRLSSKLELEPDKRVFAGRSNYLGSRLLELRELWAGIPTVFDTPVRDPLAIARSQALPLWFVAGYGPSRLLPSPGKLSRQVDPTLDRRRPLFGESLIGTGFIELLGEELGRSFAKILQSVFVAGGLLPHVTALELRGRGGIRSSKDLVEAQRFEMDVRDAHGQRIRVPATWLSQGYQSLIAWIADFVGHILLEAGGPVEAAEFAADQAGDAPGVVKAWDRAKRALLAPGRPFRALSHDALLMLVSPERRDRYRLTLARPSTKVRFRSSAHGRYVLARVGVGVDVGFAADAEASLITAAISFFFSGRGPMRDRAER